MSSRIPILVALLVVGCTPTPSRPGADPAPPSARAGDPVAPGPAIDAGVDAPLALQDDLPTLARRGAELLEALADALAVTPADCAALADHARAIMAEHREVRVASAAAVDRGHGPALDRALEAYADRIRAAAARMQPALTRCGTDPAFAAALTPFDVP